MASPQERMAHNEATFRDANEQISASAEQLEFEGAIPFVCECGESPCREITRLTRAEYEAVRAEPTHFLVVPGHEQAAGRWGRVVRESERFNVVAKLAEAGRVAHERDPRGLSGEEVA